MIEILAWTDEAWSDYVYWQGQDKKSLKRINKLIIDTKRNPFAEKSLGISFPTALKELYRLHNGEKNNWPPGVFEDGHWLMKSVICPSLSLSQVYLYIKPVDFRKSLLGLIDWGIAIVNHDTFFQMQKY